MLNFDFLPASAKAFLETAARDLRPEAALGLIPDGAKSGGLSALMKGAGKVTRFLPIPQPTLLVGPGSSKRMAQAIAAFGHDKVFIVTDAMIVKLGLLNGIQEALNAAGTPFVVFDEITPDAPIPLIERGVELFQSNGCDALLAVGGGSSMDAAKVIAVSATNPGKSLRSLAGYFKGLRTPAPVYAVPTTAGTGSEVTVAAVMVDPVRKSKLVVVDTRIVPRMAALDASLMTGLPPSITAATGIDALTHAVESYVGQWATDHTDGLALAAVDMIFSHLRTACTEGTNLEAREQMALAATYAGMAFTRANVGYVHAIAHQFGATYRTPHGLANAIMLPHVLRFSLPAITERLADLAVRAKLGNDGDDDDTLAQAFIDGVMALNRDLGIPDTLQALREDDIPALAKAACHEAETGYPVPRYMTQSQCEDVIRAVLPAAAPEAEKPARSSRSSKSAKSAKSTGAAKSSKSSPAKKASKATKSAAP